MKHPSSESDFRFCRTHKVYFIKDDPDHEYCDSYPLMMSEVEFYLNKLKSIRDDISELRILLM